MRTPMAKGLASMAIPEVCRSSYMSRAECPVARTTAAPSMVLSPTFTPVICPFLKKEAKAADRVFLATDPDREGEAISWHLAAMLGDGAADVRDDAW